MGGIGRISSTEADWFLRTLRRCTPPSPEMTAYFQSRGMPPQRTAPQPLTRRPTTKATPEPHSQDDAAASAPLPLALAAALSPPAAATARRTG